MAEIVMARAYAIIDELEALLKEDHPHYMAPEFTQRQMDFIADMIDARDWRRPLSARQLDWLDAIYKQAQRQIEEARRLANMPSLEERARRPIPPHAPPGVSPFSQRVDV
ncbi:MAG: hypothetical protein ACE15C_14635 [Phycisphaerae bacterium]